MGIYLITILMLVIGTLSQANSNRGDFLPFIPSTNPFRQMQQNGCVWSMLNDANNNDTIYPPFLQKRLGANSQRLDCHVQTLNSDFWANYMFTADQLEYTTRLNVKCNDKVFHESALEGQSQLFRLKNLQQVQIESCKLRKLTNGIWTPLGFLKSLTVSSSIVGMDIESGTFDGLSKLEKLDLSNNNIWTIHQNTFCLRSLVSLNISFNSLSDLDEVLSCAQNLQNLDVSHNALRRLSPSAFKRLTSLASIRLQNNLISEIYDNSFQGLRLRSLDISSNKLVALPPAIFPPTLRELNLSNNSITALSYSLFANLQELLLLDLSKNKLQSIGGSIFSGLSNLQILRLNHNRLTYVDQSTFNLIKLTHLDLSSNAIESLHTQAFSSARRLISLDLSRNKINIIDGRLFSNLFSLKQLYIDHNTVSIMDDDALQNCSALQDLGMAGNQLTQIPLALRAGLKNLVTLDLGENQISTLDEESFGGLSKIYGLRLVGNKITQLPSGLCNSMTNLRVLNVANNRINKISNTAFTSCKELRVLRFDANDIEELPTFLPTLPNLLWLNVSENKISGYVDYHLLPPNIEWLDISNNQIALFGSSDGGKVPYSLRVLDASHNNITHLDPTLPPNIEVLRVSNNKIKSIATHTFSRLANLRRVDLSQNELENLPLASIKIAEFPIGKPLPEFYLGSNRFSCSCEMEYWSRWNQLTLLRQYPKISDLDSITCRRATFSSSVSKSESSSMIPIVGSKPSDFLCKYTSHCFETCECCEFEHCDCHMKCPDNCSCYTDAIWKRNIVSCSNSALDQIPAHIPMRCTDLYLDANKISVLSMHAFIGKKNLVSLYLNNSGIEIINNKTFHGLKSLKQLYLQDNKVTHLRGFEFANLESLEELYLNNNRLRFIGKETFTGLSLLQVLRLDGNLLVDFNVWEINGRYLRTIEISNNPWSCDCKFLIPLQAWAASNPSSVDLSDVKCQPTTIGSNDTDMFYGEAQPVINMCVHNRKLISFNHDRIPELMEGNHISAEKVASNDMNVIMDTSSSDNNNFTPRHNKYPTDIFSAEDTFEKDSTQMWKTITISLLITVLFVLVVILFLVYRKKANLLFYSWLSQSPACSSFVSSVLPCCLKVDGKFKRDSSEETDNNKLFDAYIIYSSLQSDEELVTEKLASELERNGAYRLCFHFRDLVLSAENPLNTDMVMQACDASKRIVLVISKTFLQNEFGNPAFRSAIQSAINRYPNKLIFILLPPFTEQTLFTIYPELKGGHFLTMSKGSSLTESSSNSNGITSLEWSDKNFWSKLKLILPTPTLINSSPSGLNSTSTISSTGSSAIFNMAPAYHPHHNNLINYNNSLSLHEYAYNTINSQHLHRNILPFTPPIPKHHVALTTPTWHQQQLQNQNFYNNSQHSQIIPIPGYPLTSVGATTPLMTQNTFHQPHLPSFNESFRRHLQLQQSQNKALANHHHHLSNCSNSSQGHPGHHHHNNHHHQHQGSHCSSSHSSSTSNNNPSIHPYQPLDANYSSTSSNEELLDHVYSTLDSPPIMSGSSNNNGCESNSELISKQNNNSSNGNSIDEQVNKANVENSCSQVSPPLQNRLNNNNNNANCPVANNTSGTQPSSTPSNNNGTMYFV